MDIRGIPPSVALETAVLGIELAEKYAAVHSCHEEDFFVKNPLEGLSDLLSESSSLRIDDLINLREESCEGTLLKFLKEVESASLQRQPLSVSTPSVKTRKGFTPKKHHEAHRFEKLLSMISKKNTIAINFGEGAGHLTEVLAESGCVRAICGFDCDASLTEASNSRQYHPSTPVEAVTCRVDHSLNSSYYAKLINDCENFNFSVSSNLEECAFIGLHTCGDLGSSITSAFIQSDAEALLIVPCCYHALTEKGFPMSKFLKSHSVLLNDTSKRLACTPADRWSSQMTSDQLPLYRFRYFRAVLSSIVHPRRISPGKALLRKLSKQNDLTLTKYIGQVLNAAGVCFS